MAPLMTPFRVTPPSKVTVLSVRRVTGPVKVAVPVLMAALAPNLSGLAKVVTAEFEDRLPPSRTTVAAPKSPPSSKESSPPATVIVLAFVSVEALQNFKVRAPVFTRLPAPAKPVWKETSVFGRSRVRVLPAPRAARWSETSSELPSKRMVASPPTTRDLNGVAELIWSAMTSVP